MVIEKILKVNSTNPKVDELRAKLAQVQQQVSPTQPASTTSATTPPPKPGTPPSPKDDITKLAQLSIEEQKRLAERNNPELRLREERTNHLIMNQIKELIQLNTEATKRIKDLETKNTEIQKQLEQFKEKNEDTIQKMNSIDSRLEKFMGLYELITNQYNPFADTPAPRQVAPVAPRPLQPQPLPPKQDTSVFKVEDTLTKQSAAVEIKKEDMQAANNNFKRVEELLEQLQIKQAKDKQPLPTQTPPAVTNELHTLLAGFEDRLKQQFDRSLQEKLHQGFAALEQSLQAEVRDALKAEIEQLQKDDAEVQAALNELQGLLQASETANRVPVEEQLSQLTSGLSHLRDEVKTLPPNLYFRVADGRILKNIKDLREAMRTMTQDLFNRHVGSQRNDFADWVEHALLMPELAQLLRQITTPQAAFAAITAHDGLPNT